ncbi:DUF1624 domain-containing protein [Oleisolibacter albus]|uniref:DUF1624 domain-containing protein n=1 Tax=Oleisolibacter albus TaxID=2171757 RepID=UPI00195FE68C|nr:heparan-alpha-glucosaminide N-acetyltransferase domain-containing protein [Oleisolibacter albus]
MTAAVENGAIRMDAPRDGVRTRLVAIDALRGLVMLIMLLDHIRETVFLHHQVGDPVDAASVDPALFFTRLLSTLCAPIFVALTGLSAWLYGQSHSPRETSLFLLKRGLFLIVLELTLVSFAWSAQFPPRTVWLQVIWAIGISMLALSALIHLPRTARIALGLVIVCGHNLLDGIVLAPGDTGFPLWAMLHQRAVIELGGGAIAKTTYPVLPWIGVILLGHAIGPWFGGGSRCDPARRSRRLLLLGAGMLAAFLVLRLPDLYGDRSWQAGPDGLRTLIAVLALTKYPPSLLFLLATLGPGALLLALFTRGKDSRVLGWLAVIGGAPMFFYLLHLYVLRALYLGAVALFGLNQGSVYGVESVATLWLWFLLLLVPLSIPTAWFARLKQRRRDLRWLKYL